MGIGNLGDSSNEINDIESKDFPISKKTEVVFQNSLHEVCQLANLPENEFQSKLAHATAAVHQLFSSVDTHRAPLSSSEQNSLEGFKKKYISQSGKDSIASIEIDAIAARVSGKLEYSLSSSQIKEMSSEKFWNLMKSLVQNNPSLKTVELEGIGKFPTYRLAVMIDIQTQISPEKIPTLDNHIDLIDCFDFPPLLQHVLAQRPDLIQEDLKSNPVDVAAGGFTALGLACSVENIDLVRQLISAGADVNNKEAEVLPLCFAVIRNNHDLAQVLLTSGADIDAKSSRHGPALHFAIQKSHIELARLFLEHNANPNLLDVDGQSALHRSAEPKIYGQKYMELLISKGADVNQKNSDGKTPIMDFAYSLGKVKFFLAHGADITLLDNKGRNLLRLIEIHAPKDSKQILRVIQEARCKTIFDQCLEKSQNFKTIKMLSHVFAMKGTTKWNDIEVRLEGVDHRAPLNVMAKSVSKFAKTIPDAMNKDSARHLSQSFQFTADSRRTPSAILQRIKRGQPTIFATGWDDEKEKHSSTILLWKNMFVLCDRGGFAKVPLSINRFNVDKLDLETLELIINSERQDSKNFEDLCKNVLPERLQFRQSSNEKLLEKIITLAMQVVGNCSWASKEGIIKTYMLLDKLEADSFELPENPIDIADLKASIDATFALWQLSQQLDLLDEYLDVKSIDNSLILKCFSSLWLSQTQDSRLITRRNELEQKFCARISQTEQIDFLADKVKCLVLPPPGPSELLQGYAGSLSLALSSKLAEG